MYKFSTKESIIAFFLHYSLFALAIEPASIPRPHITVFDGHT
jgi:hypothetical protein